MGNDEKNGQHGAFPLPALVAVAVVLLVVMVALGRFCSAAATIDITVNGQQITIHGAKTMDVAIRESGLPVNPGDLVSLDGQVLQRSAGYPFYATVNGEETTDPAYALRNGDDVYVTDGKDMLEEYDAVAEPLAHSATIVGIGSICTIEQGEDGVVEHRTGRISGAEVDRVTQDATSSTVTWRSPDVGADKVLALTFEQGPSERYSHDILDLLEENEAHATFFCVGTEAEAHPDILQRERDAGCQVCTNTYDRKVRSTTSAEDLVEEVQKGRQAISDALDGAESSGIVRLPDAVLTENMAVALEDDVDAVVGWDLETADYLEGTSTETIYDVLMDAAPGSIIVMRDGGGNRSATVKALEKALPRLKKRGYTFVTIDELMEYPLV